MRRSGFTSLLLSIVLFITAFPTFSMGERYLAAEVEASEVIESVEETYPVESPELSLSEIVSEESEAADSLSVQQEEAEGSVEEVTPEESNDPGDSTLPAEAADVEEPTASEEQVNVEEIDVPEVETETAEGVSGTDETTLPEEEANAVEFDTQEEQTDLSEPVVPEVPSDTVVPSVIPTEDQVVHEESQIENQLSLDGSVGRIENVRIEGDTLVWDAHEGASDYWITCLNTDKESTYYLFDTNTTILDINKELNGRGADSGTYKFSIEAFDDSFNSIGLSGETEETYSFSRKPVQNISIDSNILKWDVYEGTETYEILAMNSNGDGWWFYTDTNSWNIKSGLNGRGAPSGTYTFQVKAVDASQKDIARSDYSSDTYEFNRTSIQNVYIDGNMLHWDAYEGAVKYAVLFREINEGDSLIFNSFEVSTNSCNLNSGLSSRSTEDGMYSFYVEAYDEDGNCIGCSDETMDSFEFNRNDAWALNLQGSILSWNAFEGANEYRVIATSLEGEEFDFRSLTNSVDVHFGLNSQMAPDSSYTFHVEANNEYGGCIGWSEETDYSFGFSHNRIQNVRIEEDTLYWTHYEEGIVLYRVKVRNEEGHEESFDSSTNSWSINQGFVENDLDDGIYSFIVEAYDDLGNCIAWSDETSDTYEFSYNQIQNVYVDDDVLNWDAYDGVAWYEVYYKTSDDDNENWWNNIIIDTNSWNINAGLNSEGAADGTYVFLVEAYDENANRLARSNRSLDTYSFVHNRVMDVQLENSTLTWEAYEGASYYYVEGIVEGGNTVSFQCDTNTADVAIGLNGSGAADGTYTFCVKAYDDSWNQLAWSDETSDTYEFARTYVQNVMIVDDMLVWDLYEGAEYYQIAAWDQEYNDSYSFNSDTSPCDLKKWLNAVEANDGTYGFRVDAYNSSGNRIAMSDPTSMTYEFSHSRIQNVQILGNTLTWDAWEGAEYYQIIAIDSEGTNYTFDSYETASDVQQGLNSAGATDGDYRFCVAAYDTLDNRLALSDETLDTYEFSYNRVQHVQVNGDILSWEACDGASEYRVYYKTAENEDENWWNSTTTDTNSWNINTGLNNEGAVDGVYVFLVEAYDENWSRIARSDRSVDTYDFCHNRIQSIQLVDNTLTWEAYEGASYYYVEGISDGNNTVSFFSRANTADVAIGLNGSGASDGTYTFRVKAYYEEDPETNLLAWSDETLDTYEFTRTYVQNVMIDGDMLFWDPYEGAVYYYIAAWGSEDNDSYCFSDLSQCDIKKWLNSEGATDDSYRFRVYAYNASGNCFAKSDETLESYEFRHSRVLNVQIVEDTLTWDSYEGAAFYYVDGISEEGNTVSFQCDTNTADVSIVLNERGAADGAYTFRVKAYDDSGNQLAWSDETLESYSFVHNRVLNVRIDGDTMTWDAYEGVTEYRVLRSIDEWNSVSHTSLDNTWDIKAEFDRNGYEDGTYSFDYVEAFDNSGNRIAWSDSISDTYEYYHSRVQNVQLDENLLTWDPYEGAAFYYVDGISEEGNTVSFQCEINTADVSVDLNKAGAADGTYTFRVKAYDDSWNQLAWSDETLESYEFSYNRVLNVRIDGDTMTWDPYEGASEYRIVRAAEWQEWYTSSTNSWNIKDTFDQYGYEDGVYGFARVEAYDESGNLLAWSDEIQETYDFQHSKVTNVRLDGAMLYWDEFEGASGKEAYEIIFRNKDGYYSHFYSSTNSVNVNEGLHRRMAQDGQYTFQIVAHSDSAGRLAISDETTEAYEFRHNIVKNVRLNGETLTWDAYEGAASYVIYGNNTDGSGGGSYRVYTNSGNVNNALNNGYNVDDGTYSFEVRAYNSNGKMIAWSDETEETYDFAYNRMENVRLEGDMLVWDAYDGAAFYYIYAEGTDKGYEDIKSVTNSWNASVWLNGRGAPDGEYKLKVVACDEEQHIIAQSDFIQDLYRFKRTPVTNMRLEGDILSWDAYEGASYYKVLIYDEEYNSTSYDSYGTTWDVNAALSGSGAMDGTYTIRYVEAYDNKDNRIARSKYVSESYEFSHEAVRSVSIAGNKLTWEAYDGAVYYRVDVMDSEGNTTSFTTYTNEWGIRTELSNKGAEDGAYTFRVNAYDSTGKHLAWSDETQESYDFAHESIRNVQMDEDVLTWDAYEGASYYRIVAKDAEGGEVTGPLITSDSWDANEGLHALGCEDGTYTFCVKAYDSSGNCIAWSDETVDPYAFSYTAPDTPILDVKLGMVWKELDPVHSVQFTGNNSGDTGYQLTGESWISSDGSHVIASKDAEPREAALVGKTYRYAATFEAQEHYVFGDEFEFVYDYEVFARNGLMIDMSDDKKTLTVSGFLSVKVPAYSIGSLDIALSAIPDRVYNGKAQAPEFTVTFNGKALEEGVDYTVSYKDPGGKAVKADQIKNVGTYTVTVTGKNNYTGTREKQFSITSSAVKPPAVTTSFTYDGTAKKPYSGAYNGFLVSGDITKTDAGSYTLKAKLRDPANTTWSDKTTAEKSYTWKIGQASIASAEVTGVSDKVYTGSKLTQAPVIKMTLAGKSVTLKSGTDYTLSYKNNINIGTATMTVTGKGNFTGTVSKTFKINPVPVSSVSLNKKTATMTEGNALVLTATVKPDNAGNKAVTWSSSNKSVATVDASGKITAKNAGTATITVTTKDGNKKATCTVTVKAKEKPVPIVYVQGCDANANVGWEIVGDKHYWYEKKNGSFVKQGVYGSQGNVWYDNSERGREIYDPCSNGWYWLDAVYDGAKAANKEVFMPYIYSNESTFTSAQIKALADESDTYTESNVRAQMSEQVKDAIENRRGKWVRYDAQGKMYKGWYTVQGKDAAYYPNQVGNTYYYDYKTGLMAKGRTIINGKAYDFDPVTGVLRK